MRTRRQAIGAAAAALAATAAAPEPAFAKGEDTGLLELMVTYQQGVVFAYDVALLRAPLTAAQHTTLTRFRGEAEQAATALRTALTNNGGRPPQRPASPAKLPAALVRQTGPHGFVRAIRRAEDNAMSGWYVSLQQFRDPRLIAGAAAFMAAAGRRLVTLRRLANEPLLPRAFETGPS